ncbi:MAG TPA: hypothetical protein VGP24_09610 [Glaciihabitans sp.]|jgi:hypothetical protein|nr:hypothetical protein [Glaciihabitans sp.]
MTDLAQSELLRRIDELEAQNRQLREHQVVRDATYEQPVAQPVPRWKQRSKAWTLLAVVLITLGAVLAPMAVVASWGRLVLTDTDRFVAQYAPLADDPQVQAFVTDQAVIAINERVDISGITNEVIDGITALGTGPRATEALELLKGPAASGIQSLIRNGVTTFVASDAFANVWASALRISHTQATATLAGDPNAAITVGPEGTIGIQLAPIIDAAKTALVDQGISLAAQIPSIDRTIVVAESEALPTAQVAYQLVLLAGVWLPWVAILLLAAGVLVARRRTIALIWAAVALGLSMAATGVALAVGNVVATSSAGPAAVPSDVSSLLYETVASDMRATSVAVIVLAVVVALVAWLAGPFEIPRKLRALANDGSAQVREAAERRDITTGRVGVWVYRQRRLLRVAVAVIGAAIVLFVRPLTPALTLWTLIGAVVVLAIIEIVARPDSNEELARTERAEPVEHTEHAEPAVVSGNDLAATSTPSSP